MHSATARLSFCFAAAIVAAIVPRSAAAQAAPAPRDSVPGAARGVMPVPVGARVRVKLRDASVHAYSVGGPVGGMGTVEGTFLAVDTAALDMRLSDSTVMTFPFESLRTLEVSTRKGRCTRSAGASVACTLLMGVGGAAIGVFAGEGVGRIVGGRSFPHSDPSTVVHRRWRWYGGSAGLGLGLAFRPLVGREHWVTARSWYADP